MDDKKKVFVVKNKYDEDQGVFATENEAKQLAAYLNSKFLKAQTDISSAIHTQKYYVKSYSIREFYRHKKLFYLIVVYFDRYPTNLLDDCPYAVANIEKTMLIDYEIEDEVHMGDGTHHIYFTTYIRTTDKELKTIAYHKLHDLWNNGKIPLV